MQRREMIGWTLVALVACSSVLPALALPHLVPAPEQPEQLEQREQRQYPVYRPHAEPEARKFAEKPNAMKKVAIDNNDLDDIQTNQITDGFSWSNMLSMIMQMLFNGGQAGPSKSEGLDDDQSMAPASPWAQVLQVGLKILSHFLGGGAPAGDGIDKVDNSSPMQFINIVVNLLDALKTSFSHRSIAARSIGKKDSVSEAAVAGISVLKGYVRTFKTSDENCMQKFLCEANRECAAEQPGSGAIYCQLGSYAASFFLQRSSTMNNFDSYYEAGRRGRSQEDCQQLYLACNEV